MIPSSAPREGTVSVGDLTDFLPSWKRHLRAENKSPRTVQSYDEAARQFHAFLSQNELPTAPAKITRRHVEAFEERLLTRFTAATAANRHRSLQQLFKWLVEENEIEHNPMARLTTPVIPEKPVPVLTDNELQLMLKTCEPRTFTGLRDEAILRTFIDTGVRLAELAGITTNDPANIVDVDNADLRIVGKGRRPRIVPLSPRTVRAIDRYARFRQHHPHALEPWFWIGERGRLSESGISQMVATRAKRAGIKHVHPHMFRHTFAHYWKSQGASEEDLMRLAGWRSRDMLLRYGASSASERAISSHRTMRPGDRI